MTFAIVWTYGHSLVKSPEVTLTHSLSWM